MLVMTRPNRPQSGIGKEATWHGFVITATATTWKHKSG